MSHFSRKDKTLTLHQGLSVITKNPISYEYFKKHFTHTIEFLHNATLTFNYDSSPGLADIRYSYYKNFVDTYKETLGLSDQQTQIIQEGGNVTVSLIVITLEHYRRKMQQNTDILKPLQVNKSKSLQAFMKREQRNHKRLYDKHLKHFSHTQVEYYTFKYKKDFQKAQELSKTR